MKNLVSLNTEAYTFRGLKNINYLIISSSKLLRIFAPFISKVYLYLLSIIYIFQNVQEQDQGLYGLFAVGSKLKLQNNVISPRNTIYTHIEKTYDTVCTAKIVHKHIRMHRLFSLLPIYYIIFSNLTHTMWMCNDGGLSYITHDETIA